MSKEIDIAALRAVAAAKSEVDWMVIDAAVILSLLDRLEQAEEDATRYRWVKKHIKEGHELPGSYCLPADDTDAWDQTVDAAKQGEGE